MSEKKQCNFRLSRYARIRLHWLSLQLKCDKTKVLEELIAHAEIITLPSVRIKIDKKGE